MKLISNFLHWIQEKIFNFSIIAYVWLRTEVLRLKSHFFFFSTNFSILFVKRFYNLSLTYCKQKAVEAHNALYGIEGSNSIKLYIVSDWTWIGCVVALSAVFLLFFGTLDRLAYLATFNASFAIFMLWGDKFTFTTSRSLFFFCKKNLTEEAREKGFNFFIFILILYSVVVLLTLICDYFMVVINCESGGTETLFNTKEKSSSVIENNDLISPLEGLINSLLLIDLLILIQMILLLYIVFSKLFKDKTVKLLKGTELKNIGNKGNFTKVVELSDYISNKYFFVLFITISITLTFIVCLSFFIHSDLNSNLSDYVDVYRYFKEK